MWRNRLRALDLPSGSETNMFVATTPSAIRCVDRALDEMRHEGCTVVRVDATTRLVGGRNVSMTSDFEIRVFVARRNDADDADDDDDADATLIVMSDREPPRKCAGNVYRILMDLKSRRELDVDDPDEWSDTSSVLSLE